MPKKKAVKLSIFVFFILICFNIEAQDWEKHYNKGWKVLSQKDSAFSYFNKARLIAIKHDSIQGIVYSGQGLIYTSGYHYDLKQLNKDIQAFKNDLKIVKDIELKEYGQSIYLFENINYNYKLGDYFKAENYIDSLFQFVDNKNTSLTKSLKYKLRDKASKYQASIYKHQGQFEQARETYRRLLDYAEKNISNPEELLTTQFSIYRLLSQTHAAAGNIEEAIKLEQRLLNDKEIQKKYLSENTGIILLLSHITHLIEVNRFKEAQEQLKLLEKLKPLNPNFKLIDLENRARLFFKLGNYKQAFLKIDESITVAIKYRNSKTHPDVIQLYIRKSQFLNDLGKAKEAFINYQSISNQLNQKENDLTFINKRLKIKALNGLFSNAYCNTMDYHEIEHLINQLISAIDFLHPQYQNAVDRQFLIEDTFETIQKAFDINATHYFKTGEKNAIELAFQLSEKYRVISLRQDFASQNIKINNQIDPALINEEKQLKSQISHLQNKIASKPVLRDSLFQLNENYKTLKKYIEKQHPKFYALKYGNTINSITEAKQFLKHDQAFLSYFFGIKHLYAISIYNDDFQLKKIAWNTGDENILKTFAQQTSKNNYDATIANQLYKKFVKEIFPNQLPQRMLIIPDGSLNFLNFELLQNQNKLLLYNTAISYDESVTLAISSHPMNPNYKTNFTGFAPFYMDNDISAKRSNLIPLFFSKQEIERINSLYSGEAFIGKEGNIERFKKSIKTNTPSSNKIYHIASHAKTNEISPENSYILFNNGVTEKLFAQDIFSLDLKNSFIALSACETGIGTLKTGQGMRSFSQAFRYAGATSLLHSKWKVSDRSTAIIMEHFYKNIATGLTKDIALQKAKIKYINNVEDKALAAPYYWAAFVINGDVETIPVNNSSFWVFTLYTVLAIILSLGLYFIYLKRKNTQ